MQFEQLIDLLEYSCLDQRTAGNVARDETIARCAVFSRLYDMREAMKSYGGANTQACMDDIVSWIKNAQQMYRYVRMSVCPYVARSFTALPNKLFSLWCVCA
jgi:hypothetical protein